MIKVNDKIPQGELQQLVGGSATSHSTNDLFSGKKVVMFAVPGAYTPTCSAAHLPGFVVNADTIKAKGVDSIICLSVNDAFVMNAWGEAQNADEVMMLADGDGSFTKAMGLGKETGSFGGYRSVRYAMIVEDGVVTSLQVEQPKEFKVSSAEAILALL
ncbi:peroxiredoxin [Thalassomonas viridans]|uniref:Glutathione-dependent peroxiredoxin n=1 Tax=Thalassomonas viridans TaxID=137584 RepID=A0AAE9Z4U5_9GAMM|nr:peroxiredoxin [Thalassomonas viridans]WDE05273.1 peroxiredoxin [Thalassomonas viridans]